MHILIVHQAFVGPDEAGGTRHYEMAQHLAARGHRVTVIASPISYLTGNPAQPKKDRTRPRQSKLMEAEPGIHILRVYTYSALHRSFVHRAISFISFMISAFVTGLRVRRVDVVWGTSPPIFQGITAWLLARLKRASFLFEVRDLWPDFAIAVGVLHNPLLIRASHWLEGFLYRRADRLIVNSPGFIQHVTEHGARWVELIPNGADPAMFDPQADGQCFRQMHNLQGKFIVLYAGAHGISNDLGVILEAASLLRGQPEIHFVLIGDGKEKTALQARAIQLGLPNVTFLPPVCKSEMGQVLAAADAGIAILKPIEMFKTTYPNKVFDYMAAGKAVILAIDGVIRKVIESSQAGVFVPPGDPAQLAQAVKDLASNPEKIRQMGIAGRNCVMQYFNRSNLAEQMALLLEDMRRSDG